MKSPTRLIILALALAGLQSLLAQPASDDQIEAARQYLRSGRFGAPRSGSLSSIRTNAVRNPGSAMRYGTRPATATAPGGNPLPTNGLSPDQERDSRRVLSDMRSLKPANGSGPAVARTPAMATPATPLPPAAPPAPQVMPTVPVVQTPPPVANVAPPVVPPPAAAPAIMPPPTIPVPTPEPVTPPVNRQTQEADALRMLEEYKQRGSPEQVEARRVQDEIRAAKTAQETRAATVKSQEEVERMKEIARIEAEVLRAKARREGTPDEALPAATPPPVAAPVTAPTATVPATLPPPEPPPATLPAPTVSIPAEPVVPTPAATIPPPAFNPPPTAPVIPPPSAAALNPPPPSSPVPEAPFRPSSPPQMRSTLTPEMELKARELLGQQSMALSPPVVPANLTRPAARPGSTPAAAIPRPSDEAVRRAAAETRAKREALEWEQQRQLKAASSAATPLPGATPMPASSLVNPGNPSPISSPLTAGKQARLEELGAAYKSDKITAAQYHAERARILAEP